MYRLLLDFWKQIHFMHKNHFSALSLLTGTRYLNFCYLIKLLNKTTMPVYGQ